MPELAGSDAYSIQSTRDGTCHQRSREVNHVISSLRAQLTGAC